MNHAGHLSPLAGVFQRLGVARDGSAVVFEVTNEFQLIGKTALSPEQLGFFYVRADGTGLRRIGPPSRDRVWRVYQDGPGGPLAAGVQTDLPFSPDGKKIAYTDLGPGPDGRESEQIFALDLTTGARRQVTRLSPFEPEPFTSPQQHHITWLDFLSNDRVIFVTTTGDSGKTIQINLDGTGALESADPIRLGNPGGGRIQGNLRVSEKSRHFREIELPGVPDNPGAFTGAGGPVEIFRFFGSDKVQLTNFNRTDTLFIGARGRHVLVLATADPFGTNPCNERQIFRVSPLGQGLRQATPFREGSQQGCGDPGPGCSIPFSRLLTTIRAQLVYSDCDAFGTNPDGSQVFAIEYDGSGLRQLTHTAGARTGADGVLEVELPGPMAANGR
jgi:hypothetical protein